MLAILRSCALALGFITSAHAQTWPDKPVRLVAPYPPGGQTDLVSRFLAERLSAALGQQVIVENRAGAQGIVGLEAVKNAAADGYTFVYANVSNISINPHVYPKLPYDGLKDFAPVTQLGLSVLGMVVPATLNVKTLPEFVAEINKVIQSPAGREQMLNMGLLATGTTPDELAAVIRSDTPRWGEVIRKANIQVN